MIPRSTRPVRRARGFTLVEVLVGALVLGIFISFVYGAVLSAFRVRSLVQSTTTAMATGSMAVEVVARDLENAFWRPVEGLDAFRAEEESGERGRIDLLTTRDSRGQREIGGRMLRSDITEVGYRTRQGEGGLQLYRREQFFVDDKPLEGGDWYKVAAGVKEFRIDWFEKDPSEEGGDEEKDALKSWDAKEKKKLPRAARITMLLEGKSSDPEKADTMAEFRFTRWVVLPGADDKEPKPAGNQPGGNQPGGNPPPGGN